MNMQYISKLNVVAIIFIGLLSTSQLALAALCWHKNDDGTKTCKESNSLACTSTTEARCTTEGQTLPITALSPPYPNGSNNDPKPKFEHDTAERNHIALGALNTSSRDQMKRCNFIITSQPKAGQNQADVIMQQIRRSDNGKVLSLLNSSVQKVASAPCEGDIKRVKVCVTGRWPLNGCYEFGSNALTCKDLLGEDESFPQGVTCSNV